MDLSFSGAGFMGCYYFGVVNCWNKYIPRDRVRRVAGASAGSLIAAYYLMDLPLSNCLKEIIEMTEDIRKRPLGVFDRSNQIVDILPMRLHRMLPDDAHKRASGRLFVAMTRLRDMKCVIVNEFETKKDLIDALNCSCFIPVWSGNHVSTYKGVKYIDGGFTNNLPVFDEHTIRICCFSGASDIAPYDRTQTDLLSGNLMGMPINFTWKNFQRGGRALWPPPASYIIELLERGFHDAKNFILSNDLIQCNRCFKATEFDSQPIFSKITPTISPAASPNVSRANSFMNLADLQRSGSFRRIKSATDQPMDGRAAKENQERKKKRRQRHASGSSNDDTTDPTTAATIRELEQMLSSQKGNGPTPSVFEGRRAKSGKQITLKSLEVLALGKEPKSFTRKLRDKLARVTSGGSQSSKSPSPTTSPEPKSQLDLSSEMPTIVVDQAQDLNDQVPERAACIEMTVDEIMKEEGEIKVSDKTRPTTSMSSASSEASDESSSDSAVGGLRSKSPNGPIQQQGSPKMTSPARPTSQSPGDKFLASRKKSVVASQIDLQSKQDGGQNNLLPDRFAFAPSQLPSCPPSPNLNRHCSECIRMRQQARMDEIDQSIKLEAERYGSMETRDPEKEFSSFRFKITNWFRQLSGSPRYSYEFYNSDDETLDDENNNTSRPPQASPQRRMSEIPSFN